MSKNHLLIIFDETDTPDDFKKLKISNHCQYNLRIHLFFIHKVIMIDI